MAWRFNGATTRGNQVTINLVNETGTPPVIVAQDNLSWTKDASFVGTIAQFRAMVKREVRAIIIERNTATEPVDETGNYTP